MVVAKPLPDEESLSGDHQRKVVSMTDTPLTTIIVTHLAAYHEPDTDRRAELVKAAWSPDGSLRRVVGLLGELAAA